MYLWVQSIFTEPCLNKAYDVRCIVWTQGNKFIKIGQHTSTIKIHDRELTARGPWTWGQDWNWGRGWSELSPCIELTEFSLTLKDEFSGSVVGMLTDCSAVGGGLGGDSDRVARWSQTGLHQTDQTVLVRVPYTQNIHEMCSHICCNSASTSSSPLIRNHHLVTRPLSLVLQSWSSPSVGQSWTMVVDTVCIVQAFMVPQTLRA